MLYLYSPDLIATANKTLQHYSAVHHLLFQKDKAMELQLFFCLVFFFEPRGTCAGETIKKELGTSPSFHESTVPLTLQLPLFQASTQVLHLQGFSDCTCYSMYWAPAVPAPVLVGQPCSLCPALAASKMPPTWNLNNLSHNSTKLK